MPIHLQHETEQLAARYKGVSSLVEPEFQYWAKRFVERVKPDYYNYANFPELQIPRKTPIEVNHEAHHMGLLRSAVEKMLRDASVGAFGGYAYLTSQEQSALRKLPSALYLEIEEKGDEEWKKRNWHKFEQVFEKYMKLNLQGYPHSVIRTELSEEERHVLFSAKWYERRRYWQTLKVKPEIQQLLTKGDQVSDVYTQMSDQELAAAAQRASADIYSATKTGGLMIFAPSGWGKSRLLGRRICYEYAKEKIGTVVLDVVGGTIDNALDTIARHTLALERQEISLRIRYCNMAGERIGDEVFVTGWPMLVKRYPYEDLHTTTQRVVDLIRTTDKNLATASIYGFNRLAPLLTSVTTILTALEMPLALAYSVLADPAQWKPRIAHIRKTQPEASEAAAELLAFYELDERKQEERAEVLRNKLSFLKFDQVSRTMFSAKEPLINWAQVAQEGLQVYIDLRNQPSLQAMEMKLFWVWNSLMEFIRSRGSSGRHQPPLAVVIDELSYFVRGSQLNTEAISEEFREFVQVRRRNANIMLTAATQERAELPKTMQSACLQLPSHLYGATTNPDTAIENAQRWYKKNPLKLKTGNPTITFTWEYQEVKAFELGPMTIKEDIEILEFGDDYGGSDYMSLEEQDYENSRRFLELPKAEWLFAKSEGEGVPARDLQHVTTANLDQGKWVREDVVSELRQRLMQRDGIPLATVLTDIAKQLKPPDDEPGIGIGEPPHEPTAGRIREL